MSDDMDMPDVEEFDRLLAAWKDIAGNEGNELLKIPRKDLRALIEGTQRRVSGLGEAVYQQGHVSLDPPLDYDPINCTFGVQAHSDGRIWVCINGNTFLRFKPHARRHA